MSILLFFTVESSINIKRILRRFEVYFGVVKKDILSTRAASKILF